MQRMQSNLIAMDQIEYRAAKAALGLSHAGMAKMLAVTLRTAIGYANGNAIPAPVAILIRLIRLMHLTPDDIPSSE